ncbi:MAG: FAD-dependent monooxygenase [Gammaproteobacteria bacterium]|nr:FAD-dependent monooxygenase [Gammaproteobacteria bacterium]
MSQSNTLASGLKVGVVGGSITGCAVATLLSRIGCEVTLFERSGEELKDRGAGLGVPPSVIETYIEHDLIDADIPYFRAGTFVRRWRTPAEAYRGYLAWDQPTNVLLMNWGMLYRNLRRRVPNASYRTAQRVTRIDNRSDGAVVALTDGVQHIFDLVVCADGYASLGRHYLFPEIIPRYAGYVLWRGALDESALADAAVLESGIHCLGYRSGHGIFYFVPNADGSVARGTRLVNWGIYVPVPAAELPAFLTDTMGVIREGSLPPGAMPLATERALKDATHQRLPSFYANLVERCEQTFVYAIYDCEVPAYCVGRIALAGDAAAFARPHSGAGALKGMNDAVALADALRTGTSLDAALTEWNTARTASGNQLVRFGNQLGRALVEEIPDWSTMNAESMERWFTASVTIPAEIFRPPTAATRT